MSESDQPIDDSKLAALFGTYFSELVNRIGDTKDGDLLLAEGQLGQPKIVLTSQIAGGISGDSNFAMGYAYPNTIQVMIVSLPNTGDYFQADPENPHLAAIVSLATIHELLHRQQGMRPEMKNFFEGRLKPLDLLTATVAVEADNYARTAQIGWRIAHDEQSPFTEIADYMKSADPKNYLESGYAVYAAAMKDKPITPENETNAMRAVVNDFMFTSHMAQRYTGDRVSGMWNYLQSGDLQEILKTMNVVEAREWLSTKPVLAGMGPDSAEYAGSDYIALGATETGNIFDIKPSFSNHFLNPKLALAFMNDEEKAALASIEDLSAAVTRAVQGALKMARRPEPGQSSAGPDEGPIR